MRAVLCLILVCLAALAQPRPDVGELIKRTGERFFALENFDVELKIGHYGDRPSERRLHIAMRDDDSTLFDPKTGDVTLVRDGRLVRIRDASREWTEVAAEGPAMRSLKGQIEPYITKFEKLVAVNFEAEFVKWEELKREGKLVQCAVVRMKPKDASQGIWKETLWIEPEEAIVWRSLWEGTRVGAGGAMSTVRQVDYEWRTASGPVPDAVFESEKLNRYRKVDRFTVTPGAALPYKVGP